MKKYLFVFVLFLGILTATAQTTSTIPFQAQIDDLMNYDPYLGRITEGVAKYIIGERTQ